jgi:branched-chain amino acid transport system substrate-binding protein
MLNGNAIRVFALAFLAGATLAPVARAQRAYDTGATDTEIKIGNIMTYTGQFQAYGTTGRAEDAYFRMVNDRGGINGRKIKFMSLDNGSDSAQSLALAQRLIEQDGVLLIFSAMGTETNLAIRAYLNNKKVPQLFADTSSAALNDPAHFPWTTGFFASYLTEGLAYAKYIVQNKPGAKIAILYANNDSGREYLSGVREGLGDRASAMIVRETSYHVLDASLDLQLEALKNSGADVFLNFSIGPFVTQSIRKAFDIGWHPLQFIPNASLSVAAFLDPAGLDKAQGIITNARSKSWLESQTQADPEVRDFLDWMQRYNPQASLRDQNNVAGYERAEALVEVLRKCGNDLTRANVMKQAASLDTHLAMLRAGIVVHTSTADLQPIHQLFLMRFDGTHWVSFGGIIDDKKLVE